MAIEDIGDGEKQVALFHIVKAMQPPKAVLLGNSGYAERLAWKSCAKDVMLRDVPNLHLIDIAVRALPEIRLVGLLAELVVIAGKDAGCPGFLEGDAETTDAAEKVYESERARHVRFHILL